MKAEDNILQQLLKPVTPLKYEQASESLYISLTSFYQYC